MESMQGPINSLWLEQASTSSSLDMGGYCTATGQMPFLKLLQGAMGVASEQEEQKPLQHQQQQQQFFASPPAADSHLELLLRFHCAQATEHQLESCVTQPSDTAPAAAPAAPAPAVPRVERRRKRPRPRAAPPEKRKKPEEAESQRMTHIAVERNRRRLMNDHLAALRSLIPASYIPRGDQATVVGGAIDYVKQLEQHLIGLQAAAAARRGAAGCILAASEGVFVSPQYTSYTEAGEGGVDVEATAAVGGHVRVRVAGRRWPGRLVRAVAAMEELRLAVLHLAATSLGDDSVVYCFNLRELGHWQMEEGCELATADEVATVVHQIFAFAGACC